MDDKQWEDVFKQMNSAGGWLESADRLKHSADVLFQAHLDACDLPPEEFAQSEDARIAGVATLLYGLAMENILKAVLLKEKVARVRTDGTVDWIADGATSHDLLSICRSSNLANLTPEQEKMMERMSAFVYWAGKYPTPWSPKDKKTNKDFKGLLLSGQPNAGAVMLPVEFNHADKNSFEGIYQALWKKAAGTICRTAK